MFEGQARQLQDYNEGSEAFSGEHRFRDKNFG
jgi:hypothetical protein